MYNTSLSTRATHGFFHIPFFQLYNNYQTINNIFVKLG